MKLELWKPVKPYSVTQAWGIANPSYLQFGFSRHNGVDFLPQSDSVLRCPVKNFQITEIGFQPTGAGNFVRGVTQDIYDDPQGRIMMVFMHLEVAKCVKGDVLQVGDIIGIADNTGFSTGPHTHWACLRMDENFYPLDKNDANNTFDQAPYLNGFHAVDKNFVLDTYKKIIELAKKVVELLKQRV